MQSNQIIQVPLSNLKHSNVHNVRHKKHGGNAIDTLAAMIDSQGLLHPLLVMKGDGCKAGQYEVVAGGRRLKALTLLVSQQKLAKDAPIECRVIQTAAATSASLVENIGREGMHPADQFLAFQKLVDEGQSIRDIAQAHGVPELVINKRLKLAQVSPKLMDIYREGGMTLEQLMQFTLTDDHKKQESVWKSTASWHREAEHLRRLLTEGKLSVSDSLVTFVGIDAYKQAGGDVVMDLLGEAGEGFLSDAPLLQQLAAGKLEKSAAKSRKEGWKWVEIHTDFSFSDLAAFQKMHMGMQELSEPEQIQLAALEAALQKASENVADAAEDADDDELYGQQDAAEAALDKFKAKRQAWTVEQKAVCGVIVTLDHKGKQVTHRGLVRPEDKKLLKSISKSDASDLGSQKMEKAEYSERLTRALTAQRNAAMQVLLVQQPDVAFVALVHALVLHTFDKFRGDGADDPIKIYGKNVLHSQHTAAPNIAASASGKVFGEAWELWQNRLPENGKDLFAWLLLLPVDDLRALMSLCVASCLDAIACKGCEVVSGQALASTLGLNMADWWTASSENYLKQVSKVQIFAAVAEALSEDEAKKLPSKTKAELVAAAEIKLAGMKWLPSLLRQ